MLGPQKASKTVFASIGKSTVVSSDHRLCAERRLIDLWQRRAIRKGVDKHSVRRWIRRKAGSSMCTWRIDANGREGCSIPCHLCRREISRLGLRVTCVVSPGVTWSGDLNDPRAPASQFTTRQRRILAVTLRVTATPAPARVSV